MHNDHSVFAEGLTQKKRLKLTFFSRKRGQNTLKVCAPLHYSKGKNHTDGLDCYYFWDYEAEPAAKNLLALSPMQILGMELTQESFDINEFSTAGSKSTRRRPQRAISSQESV